MGKTKLEADRQRKLANRKLERKGEQELPRSDVEEQGTRDGKLLQSRRKSRHSFRSKIGGKR